MITYDYTHTIDMKSEKKIFKPAGKLKGPLKNIFRVAGPNNSGKTFLMNILAWSCFADQNSSLSSEVLKSFNKIRNNSSAITVFTVDIEDPVTKKILRAVKRDGSSNEVEIEEISEGQSVKLDYIEFQQRYNLIYDIPDDPVNRLNDIIKDVKEEHSNANKKIEVFKKKVGEIDFDIEHGRDEKKIDQLKKSISEYESTPKNDSLVSLKLKIDDLKRMQYVLEIKHLVEEKESAEKAYRFVKEREDKKASRPVKVRTEYDVAVHNIREDAQKISVAIQDIGTVISKTDKSELLKQYAVLKKFNSEYIIENRQIDTAWSGAVKRIEDLSQADSSSQESSPELSAMGDILKFLERYVNQQIVLPQFGEMDNFVEQFKAKYKEMSGSITSASTLKQISQMARSIKSSLAAINNKAEKLQKPADEPVADFRDEVLIDSKNRTFQKASEALKRKLSDAKSLNITLDNYTSENHRLITAYKPYTYSGMSTLCADIDKAEEDYKNVASKNDELDRMYARWKEQLKTEEAKQDNRYSSHSASIKILKSSLAGLSSAYMDSSKKIDAILGGSYGSFDPNDKLFSSVWNLLGKKLKKIKFDSVRYDVASVNLVERKVYVDDDETVIDMDWLSTGTNQRNYLMSKLETDDSRPIIALFDEVAMMSKKTQDDIFEKFLELQKEGRLLIGMMNMPSDDLVVEQYGL